MGSVWLRPEHGDWNVTSDSKVWPSLRTGLKDTNRKWRNKGTSSSERPPPRERFTPHSQNARPSNTSPISKTKRPAIGQLVFNVSHGHQAKQLTPSALNERAM